MKNRPDKSTIAAFAGNLTILAYCIAGKALLSLALLPAIGNILVIEAVSSACLLAALAVLAKIGALAVSVSKPGSALDENARTGIAAELSGIALPLAAFSLCQMVQGMGWGVMQFGQSSIVEQTVESFLCVECGSLLGGCAVWLAGRRTRNIVNYHYYTMLGCTLLLVIPWIGASLAGTLKILSTALPWGFSSSCLFALIAVNLLSLPRAKRLRASLASAACPTAVFFLSGLGLACIGDDAMNALWRALLVVLIAASALEILRDYRHAEEELEKASGRLDLSPLEPCKLTAREQEVLVLLLQGRSAAWISKRLYISDSTARAHTKHIYQKLGVHTRDELIDFVQKMGN